MVAANKSANNSSVEVSETTTLAIKPDETGDGATLLTKNILVISQGSQHEHDDGADDEIREASPEEEEPSAVDLEENKEERDQAASSADSKEFSVAVAVAASNAVEKPRVRFEEDEDEDEDEDDAEDSINETTETAAETATHLDHLLSLLRGRFRRGDAEGHHWWRPRRVRKLPIHLPTLSSLCSTVTSCTSCTHDEEAEAEAEAGDRDDAPVDPVAKMESDKHPHSAPAIIADGSFVLSADDEDSINDTIETAAETAAETATDSGAERMDHHSILSSLCSTVHDEFVDVTHGFHNARREMRKSFVANVNIDLTNFAHWVKRMKVEADQDQEGNKKNKEEPKSEKEKMEMSEDYGADNDASNKTNIKLIETMASF